MLHIFLTGSTELGGLIWNLILALLPYFFARLAVDFPKKWFPLFFILWILFFPNALYIWTDFIHLGKYPSLIHYEIIYISTMAIAGMVAGFASLELLHTHWNRVYHHVRAWILVSSVMLLSVFGVYLGRFQRFNSWDILHEPLGLLREIAYLFLHPDTLLAPLESSRALEQVRYGAGAMNMYLFVGLYFLFFMFIYVFLYHTRRVR